ncbi:MAG: hypothetical protein MZV70_50130 [Desulfobacterales bacterium]|nr:hypothetical protein [Desulfobacterales bacterium]
MKQKRVILIAFLALLLGVGALVFWGQYGRRSAELYYSGTIEAVQSNLAFQVERPGAGGPGRRGPDGRRRARCSPCSTAASSRRCATRPRPTSQRAEQGLRQLETVLEVNRQVLPAEVERAAAAVDALQAQVQSGRVRPTACRTWSARVWRPRPRRVALDNARQDKERYDELFSRGVVAERVRDTFTLQFETALRGAPARGRGLQLWREEGFRREEIDAARARLAEGEAALRLAQQQPAEDRGRRAATWRPPAPRWRRPPPPLWAWPRSSSATPSSRPRTPASSSAATSSPARWSRPTRRC